MKWSRCSSLPSAILFLALTACGGAPKEATAPPMASPAADLSVQPAGDEAGSPAALSPSSSAEAPPDEGASGEDASIPKPPPLTPLGVPECDGFILKYVACVERHVPADQQDRLMRELHSQRARWLELEKMPEGKVAAGLSCRGVAQRLKADLVVDYGCEF